MSTNYRSIEADNPEEEKEQEQDRSAYRTHSFGSKLTILQTVLIVVTIIFLFLLTGIVSYALARNQDCLGAPFLYVSHHSAHNIVKYSRNGCALSPGQQKDVFFLFFTIILSSSSSKTCVRLCIPCYYLSHSHSLRFFLSSTYSFLFRSVMVWFSDQWE